MPQLGVALSFAVGGLLIVAAAVWVVRRSAAPEPRALDTSRVGRLRAGWLVVLTVGAVATLALTIPRAPYPVFQIAQLPPGERPVVVQVTAQQFAWTISNRHLPLGRAIRFDVTSRDVNHAFGVYDDQGHLVAQVQAMPGYTNSLVLRFDRPGTYLVRCLELCGAGHGGMVDSFCVGGCGGA